MLERYHKADITHIHLFQFSTFCSDNNFLNCSVETVSRDTSDTLFTSVSFTLDIIAIDTVSAQDLFGLLVSSVENDPTALIPGVTVWESGITVADNINTSKIDQFFAICVDQF